MTTIEQKSLRVGKYVDTNHVDTLVRTYKQERWVANSERIGKEDNVCIYYTIHELQEFLNRSKEEGADGIRIHFGVYPDNFAEKPEYAGLQTTVLVATRREETETGIVEKYVHINTEKGPRILAYNMGQNPLGGVSDDSEWVGITIVDRGDKGLAVI